ncbi:uncharacterized protein F5891DRAFT_442831 [Suillus fuscotomentosus]|uniref:Transmembrane protein n=1 Tax=Suillus fuscotomentosus TaxID=1912939 RepID=A0AAD4E3F6_9AGAM|nr:uncharacterized protein F5891DRAFT_442831 [Suillus fuscotomentosus]KAG1898897.1 hypothetical protein F5891DRAFT_442831 [Suillus fuscotomentosus]
MSRTCVSCRLNPRYCVATTSTSDPPSANRNFKNASKNTHNGLFAPRACYILHGVLVLIHIVLLLFYVHHWEHHVTFSFTPTNNDFWPVVLSASLQAFYTIYTAVLLFLTQRLAISRTLVRRVKLTAVHDISGAWAGLGSALTSVWRQTDIPASWWTTSAVAAYLASITVLHVTSSTLLQFQTFNASMTTSVPTTLGWLDDSSYGSSTYLGPITTSLQVVNHLTGLVSAGLYNTTLYDTLTTTAIAGNATVNATTVTSSCGLVPNVTYSANTSTAIVPFGPVATRVLNASTLWSDQIHIIPWTEYEDSYVNVSKLAGVYLMVSTLLEIDPSVQDEVAINMTWAISGVVTPYVIQAYFVYCSLSANTTDGVVDMQTNSLLGPTSISQPSTQWGMYQFGWSNTSWQTQIGSALATPDSSSGIIFDGTPSQITELSVADEYIMSLIGLNLTEEYTQFRDGSPPISNFTLRPDELEFAVARSAAQLIWLAGQMGAANGGIDPGNGTAYVNEEFIALRLNINLLPLAFAASASVIMLGLALHMTRAFNASHDSQAVVSNIGVLQLLWLGHRSASINEVLEDVQDPTEANLRRAGMIDVCFSNIMPNEGEFGSSTASDSLSCDVDYRRDEEM